MLDCDWSSDVCSSDLDGVWRPAPQPLGELQAALRATRAVLEEPARHEELLALVEHALGARVARTAAERDLLTLDQPGPEVIRSGQLGARGLARWAAPQVTLDAAGGALTFYANLPREDGADFVCVRIALASRELDVEVVDGGWFEIAARLG
jgi:hypothetical protein